MRMRFAPLFGKFHFQDGHSQHGSVKRLQGIRKALQILSVSGLANVLGVFVLELVVRI